MKTYSNVLSELQQLIAIRNYVSIASDSLTIEKKIAYQLKANLKDYDRKIVKMLVTDDFQKYLSSDMLSAVSPLVSESIRAREVAAQQAAVAVASAPVVQPVPAQPIPVIPASQQKFVAAVEEEVEEEVVQVATKPVVVKQQEVKEPAQRKPTRLQKPKLEEKVEEKPKPKKQKGPQLPELTDEELEAYGNGIEGTGIMGVSVRPKVLDNSGKKPKNGFRRVQD